MASYKWHPIEQYYSVIVDAMQKYQANPPDFITIDMKDVNYISTHEDLTKYKQYFFEKDRAISLDDLCRKFRMCPNGVTSENFKQALREYKIEFEKNPKIIDPFDI